MRYLPIIDSIEQSFSGEWGTEPSEEPKIKVIRNFNFTNEGKLNLNDVVERSIPKNKILLKSLKYGDIIIEKSGGSPNQPVGRVVFYDQKDGEYLFSNFTSALRSKNEVNSRYLFYLLFAHHCFKTTLSYQNKTTGILNLQLTRYLKEIKIPLPPLETQKKIAAILDKADDLRQNDKKILEKYNQLSQSVFLEMFGDTKLNPKKWEVKILEEISAEIIDCPHSTPKYIDKKTEYPCIRTTELRNGSIDWSPMKYLNKEGYIERTSRLIPRQGDVLYGREGSFGEAAIIPPNSKMSLGQRVMLFRPKYDIINSQYFLALIRSKGLYEQAVLKTSGSTVGHVNIKDIRKFKCPIPPISLQNRFAEIIENIESQKEFSNQSLQKSEDLFQSLLQRAFRGELA